MKTQKMLVGMLILGIVFIVLVIPGRAQKPEPLQPSSVTDAVGTAFSYQGQLKKDGGLVNGTCDFEFSLWNQAGAGTPPTGGTQIGTTQNSSGITVANGLFTVPLDFGSTAFNGEARYLQTTVRCAGDGSFSTLTPRQTLYAAPYALGIKPGTIISATTSSNMLTIYKKGLGFGILVDIVNPETQNTHGVTGGGYGRSAISAQTWITNGSGISGGAMNGDSASGVYGHGSGAGVKGYSETSKGVYGWSDSGSGVYGVSISGYGIYGTGNNYGLYGSSYSGYAGYFQGKVHVNGTLSKSAGGFKIDHPLDPANQYLSHSFVESPDMMNIYNGNITTDANGEAIVILPDYFEALNRDFRYQLTVIGEFAQAIVAEEIQDNRFTIKTDKPNIKVSWQVTGIRHDLYAEQNRIPVEEDKPANERGAYLYPQGYGMPMTMTVNYVAPESVE